MYLRSEFSLYSNFHVSGFFYKVSIAINILICILKIIHVLSHDLLSEKILMVFLDPETLLEGFLHRKVDYPLQFLVEQKIHFCRTVYL